MKDLKIFAKTIEPQAQAQIDLLLAQKPLRIAKYALCLTSTLARAVLLASPPI